MTKRQPVRGQAVKWCICGEWFVTEMDFIRHQADECQGPITNHRFRNDFTKIFGKVGNG